jgi:hypothetical protein
VGCPAWTQAELINPSRMGRRSGFRGRRFAG